MNEDYTNQERLERDAQELFAQVDSLDSAKLPTANIMVAGITGTGKSTLVNAVFGEDLAETGFGVPVTQNISEYDCSDLPIRIWDTVGLELDSDKTARTIKSIKDKIYEKAEMPNLSDRMHAIWYCINSRSMRYQSVETEFVKSLHSIGVPFIIVLTQCIGAEDEVNAFEEKIREINRSMGLDDIDIVQVCAKDFKMRGVPPIPAFGLEELVDLTVKKIPDFIKNGFIAAQRVSKVQKREAAERIIFEYVKLAKEGFWDKVPTMYVLMANRRIKNMFTKIGTVYNAMVPEESIKKITKDCGLDFYNVFRGLIIADPWYRKGIMKMLGEKKSEEGFSSIDLETFKRSERVAIVVAFYGYTFIEALEQLWEDLEQSQLHDIDIVCDNLVEIINRILHDRTSGKKG